MTKLGSIFLVARNTAKALDFYVAAFGAEIVERWIDPENGKIGHAEFRIGKHALFMSDEYPAMDAVGVKSPAALGGTTVNLWIEVDDLKAAKDKAMAAGARLLEDIKPATDGGLRCRIADPAGHLWTLFAPTAKA